MRGSGRLRSLRDGYVNTSFRQGRDAADLKQMAPADRETVEAMIALQPRLRRFAFGLCQSIEDADDVVQASYERALARLHQFERGTRVDNWMFSIVRSVSLNQIRATSRRRDKVALEYPDSVVEMSAAGPELRDEFRRVAESLASLPDGQRAAILLVAVEGLSYREAAEVCEISEAAFTSRLARGRLALARMTDHTSINNSNTQSETTTDTP